AGVHRRGDDRSQQYGHGHPPSHAGHPLRGEGERGSHGQADLAAGSDASSGAASVTIVGLTPRSTVSLVTTHFLTSRREGSSNCTSRRISSMIERRPPETVSRSRGL